jgi:hypothetical protein
MREDEGIMKTSVAALLVFASPALATTMVALDVPTLTQKADVIVRGTVRSSGARWSGDNRRIFTQVEIDVVESLKGEPLKTVSVVQPGGVVGDIGQKVSGVATYEEGEEVVLFLARRGPLFQTLGLAQGKFRVLRSSDGKAAFASPDSESEALLLDAKTHEPVARSGQVLKLDVLKTQIREALAAPATADKPAAAPATREPNK